MEGPFGLRCHTAGTITHKGKELTINQPQDAIKTHRHADRGPPRHRYSSVPIADNVIASLNKYLIGGTALTTTKSKKLVQDNVAGCPSRRRPPKRRFNRPAVNQQKVLIARWLANDPDVFIMDEPTWAASTSVQKYEIYCIIAEMAKQGKSIIMISSEMSELIGMSDRIMVMCDGRCTGFIDGDKANQRTS